MAVYSFKFIVVHSSCSGLLPPLGIWSYTKKRTPEIVWKSKHALALSEPYIVMINFAPLIYQVYYGIYCMRGRRHNVLAPQDPAPRPRPSAINPIVSETCNTLTGLLLRIQRTFPGTLASISPPFRMAL